MATFDLTAHPLAFAHMEGGVKTVWITPAGPALRGLSSGDRIEFTDLGHIDAGMVRKYTSLEEAVAAEGFANVVPEVADAAAAVASIRGSSEWDEAAARQHGVLAVRVRSAKRKA